MSIGHSPTLFLLEKLIKIQNKLGLNYFSNFFNILESNPLRMV